VSESHLNLFGFIDHMVGGKNVPARVNNEPGATALRFGRVTGRFVIFHSRHPNLKYSRTHIVGQSNQGTIQAIEITFAFDGGRFAPDRAAAYKAMLAGMNSGCNRQ
jgi:hypothetical protein